MPDFAKHLETFGEMGVVQSTTTIKSKLEYQGMMCTFLCDAKTHTDGS